MSDYGGLKDLASLSMDDLVREYVTGTKTGPKKSRKRTAKTPVTFEDKSDSAKNGLLERQKLAMRASAKLLKKAAKATVRVNTGALQKVIATWVRTDKKSGRVYLQLGVYTGQVARKKGLVAAGSRAHLEEFGTVKQSPHSFLVAPTRENIGAMREAQAQYIPELVNIERFEDVDAEVGEDE